MPLLSVVKVVEFAFHQDNNMLLKSFSSVTLLNGLWYFLNWSCRQVTFADRPTLNDNQFYDTIRIHKFPHAELDNYLSTANKHKIMLIFLSFGFSSSLYKPGDPCSLHILKLVMLWWLCYISWPSFWTNFLYLWASLHYTSEAFGGTWVLTRDPGPKKWPWL